MSSIPVLGIHGGAGVITKATVSPEAERDYTEGLRQILAGGLAVLHKGGSALDAVTVAVSMFEDNPLFNAGRGAVYTSAATHELDASIMNGCTRDVGAVACVHGVRNPVQAARMVMEASPHVLMTGEGAMDFLRKHGVAFEPESYFHTPLRLAQLHKAQAANPDALVLDHDGGGQSANSPLDEKHKMGTVGAVALDANGHLAAATSTGGMTNKWPGRIGDSPIIGAGCYADDLVAVSCTGTGEVFIRLVLAHDLAARMRYQGLSLQQAGEALMVELAKLGGSGGLVSVDKDGHVAFPFNSEGMYRGFARLGGESHVGVYGA